MLCNLDMDWLWEENLMSIRVQVILEEEEALRFRSQAKKESKSLSAWFREAGRKVLEIDGSTQPLSNPKALKSFFKDCQVREKGQEPDWEDHKRSILKGFRVEDEF
jgi:hypothetical protein